jgi:dipeptidyl aminopeptidase/acylaminoacyl peptidase
MPELIPRRVLFGNPERVGPSISPDGRQLGWLAPRDGVLNVWVAPAAKDLSEARPVTEDTDRGIRFFTWAPNSRHVLYLQDAGGDENWRLYDVDLSSGERRDLTPYEGVQARLEAAEPAHPDEVLVGLNKDNPELHDVYRLDLRTGELAKVVENPGFVGFLADSDLAVRAAVRMEADGSLVLYVRENPEAPWRELFTVGPDDALGSELLAFDASGRSLLALTPAGSETARLVELDMEEDRVAPRVLAEQQGADIVAARLHPWTKRPQVAVFVRDRLGYLPLDGAVAGDLEKMRALHHGDLFFAGSDYADRNWLVGFTNDTGPVPYYMFDREAGEARFLFVHQPELARYELAPMEPFAFTARDGLVVHGYATFPPGAGRRGLPAVLNVHGGPWARDRWGYHPEAQWLANRGYLCLQVNFRGSTGYGKAFLNAGDREWGGKMHDDLVDAVHYAVSQGWADPAKVAIFGGSYGGYAALAGAAFTPDVFCCAVDIVGPSNLKTLIETIPPYWAPMVSQFHRRVGNPETDSDFLWSRSPLSRAKEIKIPLLIAQGANDPRVKQAESEQIVAALKEAGIDHEYMLFPDEGHGFAKPENRMHFYAAAERFLARHLGGRFEP